MQIVSRPSGGQIPHARASRVSSSWSGQISFDRSSVHPFFETDRLLTAVSWLLTQSYTLLVVGGSPTLALPSIFSPNFPLSPIAINGTPTQKPCFNISVYYSPRFTHFLCFYPCLSSCRLSRSVHWFWWDSSDGLQPFDVGCVGGWQAGSWQFRRDDLALEWK